LFNLALYFIITQWYSTHGIVGKYFQNQFHLHNYAAQHII